ncbi:hypothetical protein FGG08_006282 [Glutinoglossum americanum]|uniref:Stress-activated map kinase-interacting protein n=1 Tax=Glutinoglossum americanum TaxID=1670608 RepID=A0A9P8I5K6_9PEZI|nr:hypothetical protein FGG08_006282 [Glutinoglossum americanum]
MSILVSDEFDFYRLRTSYLTSTKDGVGERLISVNGAIVNNTGFRSAGWDTSQNEAKRTYSPPIPSAIAAEYFQAPPRSAGLPPPGFGDDEEEGGMVTGGGGGDTVGFGVSSRRRRRREQEDQDSSDLSDDSDEDAEAQRAAHQIKFAKMPVRTRAGSSPIRQSNRDNGPSVLVTSPSKPYEESRFRRGSLGAVETIKERARRDTATSSDLSSENEFGSAHLRRRRVNSNPAVKANRSATQLDYTENRIPVELDDEDSGDGSDSTSLSSSDFAQTPGSPSFLDSLAGPSSPLGRLPTSTAAQESPRKSRLAPSTLSVLPPPRPISAIAPKSALAEAIKKSRLSKASPLEIFASLSGTADQKPLVLKMYAPFSEDPEKGFDVLIRRTTQKEDNPKEGNAINLGTSPEREVTVYDVIGLGLWRYTQEKREPLLTEEQTNANRWLLQMAEDGEPDEDLVLERTKTIASFASNNNQRAARGARARGKAYDEFALIEATEEQFKENERLTPNVQQEVEREDTGVQKGHTTSEEKKPEPGIHLTFQEKLWKEFGTPIDAPQPSTHAHPRMGAPKILRIHLHELEPYATSVSVDVRTDTYMAEVLEIVCKKRHLDAAQSVLKVRGTNIVVPLDRTVEALGNTSELDLLRRRFADGLDNITGSPGSISPNAPLIVTRKIGGKGGKQVMHPLADVQASAGYKKYTVWRRNQPTSFFSSHERILAIDGEWIHVMPSEDGGTTVFGGSGKTSSIHFSTVIGCKVKRTHPKQFKILVLKSERESKKYDFEALSRSEAAEIVEEIMKGMDLYKDATMT